MHKYNVFRRMIIESMLSKNTIHHSQFPILEFIYSNGSMSQKEIADALKVTPAAIALSTKRLVQSGYLKKEKTNDNKRCNIISITIKGKKAVEESKKVFIKIDKMTFKDFTEEEFTVLKKLLEKMIFNITGDTKENIDKYEIFYLKQRLREKNVKK